MTPKEQCNYLAVEIMGWKYFSEYEFFEQISSDGITTCWDASYWNPTGDWNHFRMVEEKVMEDEEFMENLTLLLQDGGYCLGYIKADLPARVTALIEANKSLPPDNK